MGNVKQANDQMECHYCGQLWFISELQDVCIANGPDDFQHVGMCDECADAYEEYCSQHEDDYKEQKMEEEDDRNMMEKLRDGDVNEDDPREDR